MIKFLVGGLLASTLFGASANAGTLTYSYSNTLRLDFDSVYDSVNGDGDRYLAELQTVRDWYGGFEFPITWTIVLDEGLFGGSFAGQTVEFTCDFVSGDWAVASSYVTGLSTNAGYPCGVAPPTYILRIDKDLQIEDWEIDVADGPPDFGTTSASGDYLYDGLFLFRNSTPGTWELDYVGDPLAPIPLPAGLPLLLAGLGALGFVARKKKQL